MNLVKLIDFLRDRLKTVIRISYVVLALLIVHYWFFVDKHSAHTKMEHIPFFWAAFGFIACLLIIFVSKWYGHLGIMTREDYYDE
jgi:DMSO/TMAO reductase YedYZ heme-binding membrane subunit